MFSELISDFAAQAWHLLVAASFKVILLLIAVECLARQSRHRSPAARHWIWGLGVLACLALPVLAFLLPAWGLLPEWTDLSHWTLHAMEGSSGEARVAAAPSLLSLMAPLLWGLGVCLVAGRWLLGRLSLASLARHSGRVFDGPLRTQLDRLSIEIGLRRQVFLLVSDQRTVPMTWGVLRPTLLLPAEAERWDAERTASVMLHELAHLRRGDCLWQLAAQLACALYWFHPFVWRAAREMHIERESACDDLVLTTGVRPTCYAESLLDLTRNASTVGFERCSAVAMAAEGVLLEMRLISILDARRVRAEPRRGRVLLGACAATLLAIPLAMVGAVVHDKKARSVGVAARTEAMPTDSPTSEAAPLFADTYASAPAQTAVSDPSLLQLLQLAAEGRLSPPVVSADWMRSPPLFASGSPSGHGGVPLLDRRIAASWRDDHREQLETLGPQRLDQESSLENVLKAWSAASAIESAKPSGTHSQTSLMDNVIVLDSKGPMSL